MKLVMKYALPSFIIVMVSVGVRKVGIRTEVYIVPETTSCYWVRQDGSFRPRVIENIVMSDWKHRHESLMIDRPG